MEKKKKCMNPLLIKLDRVNLKSAFLSTTLSPSLQDGGDLITHTPCINGIVKCRRVLIHIQLCTEGYWKHFTAARGRGRATGQGNRDWQHTQASRVNPSSLSHFRLRVDFRRQLLTLPDKIWQSKSQILKLFPNTELPEHHHHQKWITLNHCLRRPQFSNAVLLCENTQNGN